MRNAACMHTNEPQPQPSKPQPPHGKSRTKRGKSKRELAKRKQDGKRVGVHRRIIGPPAQVPSWLFFGVTNARVITNGLVS